MERVPDSRLMRKSQIGEARTKITLKDNDFDRFLMKCDTFDRPNQKLMTALKEAKNKGF